MAVPAWPSTVPAKFLLDDFQVAQSHTPPLKSEMAAGNVRMRPQFTVRVTTMRVSILMTNAELQAFEDFLFNTLAMGTSKFTMPIFHNGVWQTKTCYFTDGTAAWQRVGEGWKVAFGLSVEAY